MNSKLKAGGILLVVFIIGVMAGFASLRFVDDRPLRIRNPGLDPYRKEPGVVERIEKRLTDIYNLSEDQKVEVKTILLESQNKYDAFFEETRPTFDKIRQEQRNAIREILTPEQLEKFEAWLEERRKHREARGGHRGPERGAEHRRGPPPPPADNSP